MKLNVSLKNKVSQHPKKSGLKLKRKLVEEPPKEERPKKTKSLLPSGEYKDEFPPEELKLSDSMKCVFSVKRKGEFGLPYFDMRLFATTDRYTGPTKQGLSMPIDRLAEVINKLNDIYDGCEEKSLFKEFEE